MKELFFGWLTKGYCQVSILDSIMAVFVILGSVCSVFLATMGFGFVMVIINKIKGDNNKGDNK